MERLSTEVNIVAVGCFLIIARKIGRFDESPVLLVRDLAKSSKNRVARNFVFEIPFAAEAARDKRKIAVYSVGVAGFKIFELRRKVAFIGFIAGFGRKIGVANGVAFALMPQQRDDFVPAVAVAERVIGKRDESAIKDIAYAPPTAALTSSIFLSGASKPFLT